MADDEAFEDRDDAVASGLPSDFRASVSHALAELGYHAASWEPEGVNALAPDDGRPVEEREHYIGLGNLYRRAKGVEHAEWALMIQEFLQHITGTLTGKIPDDLAAIAERLRPRLGRPFSREAETYPWGVPLPGTGLEINLVVDFPNTMAYVTPAMLKKTRSSAEDLLDRALANLRDATPGDFFEHVSEELDILVGHTGDGYDAARALLIEDLLPESAAGFLVAGPLRGHRENSHHQVVCQRELPRTRLPRRRRCVLGQQGNVASTGN
jgi:hypothetical protein